MSRLMPGQLGSPAALLGGPPGQVVGLAATAGNAQVALAWTATPGAVSYNVYSGTTSGAETLLTSVATNSYTNTGLTNGTTYYYQVRAVSGGGMGTFSTEASSVPGLNLWLGAFGTLWQNTGKTVPAVANADPIGDIVDLSGNGNDGSQATDAARPTLAITSGQNSLVLSGSQFWTTPTLVPANVATISLAAWIKTSDVTASNRVILDTRNAASSNTGAIIYLNQTTGVLVGYLYNKDNHEFKAGGFLGTVNCADGAWHHVAMTCGGATAQLYVDGASDGPLVTGTFAYNGANTGNAGYVGEDFAAGSRFHGSFYEVMEINISLSAVQVLALYNRWAGRLL